MSIPKILEAFDKSRSVSTDTRKIKPGDVFFALKGDNFNGNRFAAQALETGASVVVVDEVDQDVSGNPQYIVVDDVLKALQDTATAFRRRFSFPVIGITGSNGKTTTKELLHAVIASECSTMATIGNLNNHIGVPLTLLRLTEDLDMAIIEMGANKLKDIEELVHIAEPTHGLVTNIGNAHLEGFGSIDGVEQTKGEMYDFLHAHQGFAWINENDPRVTRKGKQVNRNATYGQPGSDFFIVEQNHSPDGMELSIQIKNKGIRRFSSKMTGSHNAENVLAAVAIGDHMGISTPSMQKAIAAYEPRMNRSQFIKGEHFDVLLDAYNANPSSMEATLKIVSTQQHAKIGLILGDMFELGSKSHEFHCTLVEQAHTLLPGATLIGVGEAMVKAIAASSKESNRSYATADAAKVSIVKDLEGCSFILIKGSRGMALEKLLPTLGIEP